jgi:hypothetical protein
MPDETSDDGRDETSLERLALALDRYAGARQGDQATDSRAAHRRHEVPGADFEARHFVGAVA